VNNTSIALALAVGLSFSALALAADELAERRAIREAAAKAFTDSDFAKLEKFAAEYRSSKARTPSGTWKLTRFYHGVEDTIGSEFEASPGGFDKVKAKIDAWAKKYPQSPAAHIAYSALLMKHAWSIRGIGLADTVPPEAWAPFARDMRLARQSLERFKAVASVDPHWYENMLLIATAESWDRQRFDALLNEALDREPYYYDTYFSALEYLLPQWHGDEQQIEDFAEDAAGRTAKVEGRGMYARIYWYASQRHFKSGLFAYSRVDWPKMKAGFDDVIARYPDEWNLNNYAHFACLAQDQPKMEELFKRMGSQPIPEAWEDNLYEPCKMSALGWTISPEQLRRMSPPPQLPMPPSGQPPLPPLPPAPPPDPGSSVTPR
jgi:hypothetical protein